MSSHTMNDFDETEAANDASNSFFGSSTYKETMLAAPEEDQVEGSMVQESNASDAVFYDSNALAPAAEDGSTTAAPAVLDSSSSNNDNKEEGGGEASDATKPNNEIDQMTREAGLILDEKLHGVRDWCKKLLQEITVYNKVCAKAQAEYIRIQRLEHQESDRLDQVEPDVKGATSHLLLNR